MDNQLPPTSEEVEITPEMIEAGEATLQGFFGWQLDGPDEMAVAVFRSMISARAEERVGQQG